MLSSFFQMTNPFLRNSSYLLSAHCLLVESITMMFTSNRFYATTNIKDVIGKFPIIFKHAMRISNFLFLSSCVTNVVINYLIVVYDTSSKRGLVLAIFLFSCHLRSGSILHRFFLLRPLLFGMDTRKSWSSIQNSKMKTNSITRVKELHLKNGRKDSTYLTNYARWKKSKSEIKKWHSR